MPYMASRAQGTVSPRRRALRPVQFGQHVVNGHPDRRARIAGRCLGILNTGRRNRSFKAEHCMNSDRFKEILKAIVFQVAKLAGLFRLARWSTRSQLLILCYHGFELVDESGFRPMLFMRTETFARRLETIRRHGHAVVPLGEAVRRLREGTLPRNAVCLTIDDGFYSVLACAAPLLRQHGFAATLYVTSYYADKGVPIFRLVVQYMFWKTALPTFKSAGQPWGPSEPVDLSDTNAATRAMWRIIDYGENHCDEPGRQEICRILGRGLNVDYAFIVRSRALSLVSAEEIRQLSDAGIDIQLHTHRHRLPQDDESALQKEILENARFLEGILERPLQHLCYPSGLWNRSQWPCLAELGIASATTCEPGFNSAHTPPLGLYRVLDDSTVSQLTFEAELSGFSEWLRRVTGRRRRFDLKRGGSAMLT
jgi:peptidoglycan/xylan/chitin deacetylase (PgdA/CDA1 family)